LRNIFSVFHLLKKEFLEKNIFYFFSIIIILAIIIMKPFSGSEFLCIGLLIVMNFCIIIKKEFKSLKVKYKNDQQLLLEIFKNCPDLIFYKDIEFRYISSNEAFRNEMGLEFDELVGKTDYDILAHELAEEVEQYDRNVLKTGKTSTYYQKIITPSGECRIYNIIKSPLMSEDGKIWGILGISRDVTSDKQLQEALEEKRAQLSAILENIPFWVYMKDLEGKYVNGNKKSVELCGKSNNNLIGINPSELFVDCTYEEIVAEDKYIIENKKMLSYEKQLQTISGLKWVEVNKAPIINDNGDVTGIVVINKDMDFMKEIENQKETFVATLTHDLKIPTMAQIRALEILLKESLGTLNTQQKEVLEQVSNSCQYMLKMISTLLSTYRYDSGVKNIHCEMFDFPDLIAECCNEISYLMEEKKQKIVLKNSLTEKLAWADRLEIKRVLTNLISNAISYSFANSEIEILMTTFEKGVSVEIKNNGDIINQETIEKLFDKYVSHASKFKKIGVGLGLYLSKQIIDAHNGEIFAESTPEKGNIFGFRLPNKGLSLTSSDKDISFLEP